MSATNATPFLKLPEFVPTDKPTWLGDFNHAMTLIDTGIASADNQIKTQTTQINQALTQADAAGKAAEAAAAAAREATTAAQEAAITAKAAETKAQVGIDLGNDTASKLNLITHLSIASKTDLQNKFGMAYGAIYFDTNADMTVFKLYGNASGPVSAGSVNNKLVTIPNTSYKALKTGFKLNPREGSMWINRCGLACSSSTMTPNNIYNVSLCIAQSGDVYIYFEGGIDLRGNMLWMWLPASFYFAEDFGNAPVNESPSSLATDALEERVTALETALKTYAATIPAKE